MADVVALASLITGHKSPTGRRASHPGSVSGPTSAWGQPVVDTSPTR
jgi:hypothetical protein